jgi:hypothetical protein
MSSVPHIVGGFWVKPVYASTCWRTVLPSPSGGEDYALGCKDPQPPDGSGDWRIVHAYTFDPQDLRGPLTVATWERFESTPNKLQEAYTKPTTPCTCRVEGGERYADPLCLSFHSLGAVGILYPDGHTARGRWPGAGP